MAPHLKTTRKQRERERERERESTYALFFHLDPQPVVLCYPHSGGSSPLGDSSLEMPPQTHPEVCFTNLHSVKLSI
jgi:hypothetical protein